MCWSNWPRMILTSFPCGQKDRQVKVGDITRPLGLKARGREHSWAWLPPGLGAQDLTPSGHLASLRAALAPTAVLPGLGLGVGWERETRGKTEPAGDQRGRGGFKSPGTTPVLLQLDRQIPIGPETLSHLRFPCKETGQERKGPSRELDKTSPVLPKCFRLFCLLDMHFLKTFSESAELPL